MGLKQWWRNLRAKEPSASAAIPQTDDIKDIHADIAQGVSEEKEEEAHG